MSIKLFPDYYKILGTSPLATEEEIKKAYRRLAKQHHPDLNRNPGEEKLFAEITDAYKVLSDPAIRRAYNYLRSENEVYQEAFDTIDIEAHRYPNNGYIIKDYTQQNTKTSKKGHQKKNMAFAGSPFLLPFRFFKGKILAQLILIAMLATLAVASALTIASSNKHYQPQVTPKNGQFKVVGNKIYTPGRQIFIVKGVATAYGTFAGGDEKGYGYYNYVNAPHDFDIQKSMGINTIRIFVQATNNDPRHKEYLTNVIAWARQRGFVVELANVNSTAEASLPWLSYLARTYKNDPYVWIEPMSEPNCSATGHQGECNNWQFWQTEENAYIHAIRDAGMMSPIVINSIDWSWDLSKIDQYHLDDNNIIYGVHRYGNNNTTFDASEQAICNQLWANLSSNKAIVIDEVGAWNSPSLNNSFKWLQGFIDFATHWVQQRGGAGIDAFVWRWSDQNSMTDTNGTLSKWGNLFYTQYLQQIKP